MAKSLFKKLSWEKQWKNILGTFCLLCSDRWPLGRTFKLEKNLQIIKKIAEQKNNKWWGRKTKRKFAEILVKTTHTHNYN